MTWMEDPPGVVRGRHADGTTRLLFIASTRSDVFPEEVVRLAVSSESSTCVIRLERTEVTELMSILAEILAAGS